MRRTPSQNVLFHGISSNDDPYEPPGRTIAKAILRHLRDDGFTAADEDNWRDCGWSIEIEIEQVNLQLALAEAQADQWLAQIVPLNEPGMLARWFGRRFVDRSEEVLAVARSVDRWLRESGCSEVLWQLDGFPTPATSMPVPVAPS